MKKFKIVTGIATLFAICFMGTSGVTTVDAHSGSHSSKSHHSSSTKYYHGYKAHTHKNGKCPYR